MNDEDLIARLAGSAQPVRRLGPPWQGALLWLGMAAALMAAAVAIMGFRQDIEMRLGLMSEQVNLVFALLTGVLAAFATFNLARPDGDERWFYAPLLPALGWVAGMGLGCLRDMWLGGFAGLGLGTSFACTRFILGFGIPMTLSMLWMVRHGALVRPVEVSAMAGLAAAAIASIGLTLLHHLDAAAMVLIWHGGSVLLVIWAAKAWGGRALVAMGPKLETP